MLLKSFIYLSILTLLSAARSSHPEARIVGGHFIPIEYVPWQVSILYDNKHFCGGSILSEWIVLSAAHSLLEVDVTKLSVRAGSSHWKKDGQLVKVSKSITHKGFIGTTFANDIAVLFLTSPLKFNNNVQKIDLAEQTPSAGTMTLVTGWGRTLDLAGFAWPILQGVHLSVVDHNKCQKAHQPRKILKNMICAAAQGRDSCRGDSGGPLISINDGQLIGIVSFGSDSCNSNVPGVYTDVASFRNWINTTINNIIH